LNLSWMQCICYLDGFLALFLLFVEPNIF
jgi:hypothetical protein